MTQSQIDRLVSYATGEPVREIHRRGFGLADSLDVDFDPEPSGLCPTNRRLGRTGCRASEPVSVIAIEWFWSDNLL